MHCCARSRSHKSSSLIFKTPSSNLCNKKKGIIIGCISLVSGIALLVIGMITTSLLAYFDILHDVSSTTISYLMICSSAVLIIGAVLISIIFAAFKCLSNKHFERQANALHIKDTNPSYSGWIKSVCKSEKLSSF